MWSDNIVPDPEQVLAAVDFSSSTSLYEHWLCDFVDLTSYAFGITTVDNSTPEVRGDLATIPQRNGVLVRNNRSYDAGDLSLSMWVVGCDENGAVPSYSTPVRRALFEKNLSTLISLLGAQNSPVNLTKLRIRPGDGNSPAVEAVSARAISTGSTSVSTMMGRQRAELVFTFSLVDAFWSSSDLQQLSVSGTTLPLSLPLSKVGDAPVDDSIITIAGPISSPTVTCAESGVSFTYNGNIDSGHSLVVDSGLWTAILDTNQSVISDMTHIGHPRFMYIPPRAVPQTAVLTAPITIQPPTLTLSGAGASANTTLSVTYTPRYQVA